MARNTRVANPDNGRMFGNPGDFDVDLDNEYRGVIGGEMCDRDTVGPVWDWRPGEVAVMPDGCKVLGELDHNEFHTARDGSMERDRSMGGQVDPVRAGSK